MTWVDCTDSVSIVCLLLLGLLWYIGGSPPVLLGLQSVTKTLICYAAREGRGSCKVRGLNSKVLVLLLTFVMCVDSAMVKAEAERSVQKGGHHVGVQHPLWCGLELGGQVEASDLVARASVVSKSKVQGGRYFATFRIDKLLYSSDQDLMTKFLRLELDNKQGADSSICSVFAKVKPNNKYLVMAKKKNEKKVGIFASASHYALVSPPVKSSKKLVKEVKSILVEAGNPGGGSGGSQRVRVRRGRGRQDVSQVSQVAPSPQTPQVAQGGGASGKEVLSRRRDRVGKKSRTRLSCSARGNPPPTLYWTMNGKKIENSPNTRIVTKKLSKFLRKSVLRLKGSVSRSSVHLQCHAYNAYGHTSKVKLGKTIQTDEKIVVEEPSPKRRKSSSRFNGRIKSSLKGLKSGGGPSSPGLIAGVHGMPVSLSRPGPLSSSNCPIPDFCMNGGTCHYFSTIREQTCHCAKGYRGRRCERKYASTTGNLGPAMSDRFPLCLRGLAHYPC